MGELLRLGEIPRDGPYLQVAGTAGKGSVCALVERGLRAAGLRTGLYTSPHLVDWEERVRIDGKAIGREDFEKLITRWLELAARTTAPDGEGAPSGFELLTAAGLDHFRRRRVDVGILEVGLGGRLDATGAVRPELCAIVTIGLDHQDVLGETLEEIAAEKAGILRPGVPVLLGPMAAEAEAVIRDVAARVGAPILPEVSLARPRLRHLHGAEQEKNLPLAISLAWHWLQIHGPWTEENWKKCLAAMALARWPGRWDVRSLAGRSWIFDATLNACALPYLRRNWENFCRGRALRPSVVTASLDRRRAQVLVPYLASVAGEVIFVAMEEERALAGEELVSFLPKNFSGPVTIVGEGELDRLKPRMDPVLVTGSIHLTGLVLAALARRHPGFVPVGDL
jgi:dihydrofolate synthase/folylpolyglutamate synthase